MANELTTLEKGTIDDDTGHALPAGPFVCSSSAPSVATAEVFGGYWYAVGQTPGTALITATRLSDGGQGSFELAVVAAAGGEPFDIHLGAISPK